MKCPKCGSEKTQKRGLARTLSGDRTIHSCNDCPKTWRVAVSDGAVVVKGPALPAPAAEEIHATPIEIRASQRALAAEKEKGKQSATIIKALEAEVDLAHKRADVLDALKSAPATNQPFKVKPISKGNEATAVIVLSDLHIEERVDKEKVNGINEYNPDIARARLERVMQGALIMIKQQQTEININTVVLAILGDIITGYIHEELMETNYMSPIQASLLGHELLTNSINLLLDNTKCDLLIPCCQGNHGRTSVRPKANSYADNSFEYMLYRMLEKQYAGNKRVKFLVTESQWNVVDFYGYTVRFHHGDDMNYGGGVGGITIPINKAIDRLNSMMYADLDVFGHFHQLVFSKRFICNGSLIGVTPWGMGKFIREDSQQAFFLIDKKRKRYTLSCPLFTE